MSNESSEATAGPGRVRATAWSAALPVALAVGAVFAAPIAAVGPAGTFGGSIGADLADTCASPATQATPASDVAFGAAKWPGCAGD